MLLFSFLTSKTKKVKKEIMFNFHNDSIFNLIIQFHLFKNVNLRGTPTLKILFKRIKFHPPNSNFIMIRQKREG